MIQIVNGSILSLKENSFYLKMMIINSIKLQDWLKEKYLAKKDSFNMNRGNLVWSLSAIPPPFSEFLWLILKKKSGKESLEKYCLI